MKLTRGKFLVCFVILAMLAPNFLTNNFYSPDASYMFALSPHTSTQLSEEDTLHPPIEIITSLPTEVRVVVFDWDETLFIGSDWREAEQEQLIEVLSDGKNPTDELLQFVQSYMQTASGVPSLQRKKWLREEALRRGVNNIKTAEEYHKDYWNKREESIDRAIPSWREKSPLVPGSLELLKQLNSMRIPMFIVTAGSKRLAIDTIEVCGIRPFFDEIYGEENEDNSQVKHYTKALALRRIIEMKKVEARKIAFLGDGVADIRAAKEAGVIAVGVANDPAARGTLIQAGADVIINHGYRSVPKIVNVLLSASASQSLPFDQML